MSDDAIQDETEGEQTEQGHATWHRIIFRNSWDEPEA
jgi:hypothetical protein